MDIESGPLCWLKLIAKNRRNTWEAYTASLTALSINPFHCWIKYIRNIRAKLMDGRPRFPLLT